VAAGTKRQKPGEDTNLQGAEESNPPDIGELGVRDVAAALNLHVRHTFAEPIAPGLYLVATPIGNLSDITVRALHVLARADIIYCEDTRHSRTLMEHFAIKANLKPYHEHNAARQRPHILKALAGGARIALISDAGTPLISDPGYKIVREVVDEGYNVYSIPGASAALVAVTSAGLPTDTMLFAGFLPPKQTGRRKRIAALAATDATLIFFESPHRLADALGDMCAELGERPACIARELTKLHEEVRHGPLSKLHREISAEPVKGECVVIVAPPVAQDLSDDQLAERLEPMLVTLSLKDAARSLADELGVNKGRVYDLGLALKKRDR